MWSLGAALAALLAGLAVVQAQAQLPPVLPWAVTALATGALALALRRRPGLALALLLPAAFSAGLAWASWLGAARLADSLPRALEGQAIQATVTVVGLPQALPGFGELPTWRLLLKADEDWGAPGGLLSVNFDPNTQAGALPRAGERWQAQLLLRRVHAMQNPGLPDAELWLLERGIRAQGRWKGGQRLASAPWWSLEAARQGLRERIDTAVDSPRARAVLAGLLIGDQAAMSSSDWALLRDTGVVHLFSISGLHITGFAWLTAVLIGRLWRAWPPLCRALPAPQAARWGGLLLATAYALLAGWGVPAQRTVALLALVALLHSSGRLWPWPLALLACATPIALADPWALWQPGFWLSFVAVALLMQSGSPLPSPGQGRWLSSTRELLRTQAVCTLGLAPLTVLFFGQVSLVGVLANLVAVPLVTLLLVPLALLGLLLPLAWSLGALGVSALFALLQGLAAWPAGVWHLPQAPWALQALALLGLLLAALRLPRAWRLAGGLLVLPLFVWSPARPPPGAFQLRVFDVGQGSAVWIQTADHALLYDAGPRWGPPGGSDAAARVLLPSLRAAGVRRLDAVLLSHGDADHAGGWPSLRAGLPVGQLLAPADPRLARLGASLCEAGRHWVWDGVRFELLHPPPGFAAPKANALSCVLRVVDAQGHALLLTGDIGAAEERLLPAGQLAADVLLLPHHGSAGGSSPAFLQAAAPRLAFAQAGYRNRHGHPAPVVQQRLQAAGIPLLSSAGCGAFDWDSREPPSAAGCWRRRAARWWHQGGLPGQGDEAPPELP